MRRRERDAAIGEAPRRTGPSELLEHVRRFDPFSLLEVIGRVSLTEDTNTALGQMWATRPDARVRALSLHALAEVARFAIRAEAVHRRRTATADDVVQAVNIVNGLEEPVSEAAAHDLADWGLYLMRLGAKQFPLQLNPGSRLMRMLVLFNDLPPEVPGAADYSIPQRFQEVTGLTIEQFTWNAFVLWSQVQRDPILDVTRVISHDVRALDDMVNETTVTRTLNLVSATLHELRVAADAEAAAITDRRHEHWAFNPLYASPLIRLPGRAGRYIAPVPRLILERLAEAPYWILLDEDHLKFTNAFGHVFERYVGWLLEPFLGRRLRPEFEYASGKKTSDWLVFDDDGTTLIECKTGRLHKAAKTVGSADVVADSVKTHLGQAVKQLHLVSSKVSTENGLTELRGKPILPLVVLLDEIYTVNSPLFQPFRERARAAYGVPHDFDPQVASVSEMELLAPLLADRSLAQIHQSKLTTLDHRYWDWGTYAGGQLGQVEHPLLKTRWDEFTAPIEDEAARRAARQSP